MPPDGGAATRLSRQNHGGTWMGPAFGLEDLHPIRPACGPEFFFALHELRPVRFRFGNGVRLAWIREAFLCALPACASKKLRAGWLHWEARLCYVVVIMGTLHVLGFRSRFFLDLTEQRHDMGDIGFAPNQGRPQIPRSCFCVCCGVGSAVSLCLPANCWSSEHPQHQTVKIFPAPH